MDWEEAKADVRSFIMDTQRLDIWSKKFFLELLDHLKIEIM
jgi:hypothetical protein